MPVVGLISCPSVLEMTYYCHGVKVNATQLGKNIEIIVYCMCKKYKLHMTRKKTFSVSRKHDPVRCRFQLISICRLLTCVPQLVWNEYTESWLVVLRFNVTLTATCVPQLVWNEYTESWSVVLRYNVNLTAKVTSWQSVTHMCFLAYSHQY